MGYLRKLPVMKTGKWYVWLYAIIICDFFPPCMNPSYSLNSDEYSVTYKQQYPFLKPLVSFWLNALIDFRGLFVLSKIEIICFVADGNVYSC